MLIGMRSGVTFPALGLDFTSGFLDSRITFSRPSLATYFDGTGKLTYAPNNLVQQSQAFNESSVWANGLYTGTITPNTLDTVAPDGTNTAEKFDTTAINSFISQSVSVAAVPYVYSFYAKAGTASSIRVNVFDTADHRAVFSLVDGSVSATANVISTNATNVGNGWWRVSIAYNGSVATASVRVLCPQTGTVYVWGAQLETVTYQTTPRTYNATTSAAYYGPRFDYNPATLAARGLLIEEARTNICLRSQDATVSPWSFDASTGSGITLTGGLTPDGVTQFAVFNEGTSTGAHRVNQGISTAAATAYTISAYIKAGTSRYILLGTTRGGIAIDTQDWVITETIAAANTTTSNGSLIDVGGGVYRASVSVSHTTDTSSFFIISTSVSATPGTMAPSFAGTSRTAIFTFCQFEVGSFATSYIPTAASSVARSADSASMTGTNFSSWYNQTEGTFVAEVVPSGLSSSLPMVLSVSDGSTANIHQIYGSTTTWVSNTVVSNSPQTSLAVSGYVKGTQSNIAFGYQQDNFALVHNGSSPSTDLSGLIPAVNILNIGQRLGSLYLNGWIAYITYYSSRLSNDTIQGLTA